MKTTILLLCLLAGLAHADPILIHGHDNQITTVADGPYQLSGDFVLGYTNEHLTFSLRSNGVQDSNYGIYDSVLLCVSTDGQGVSWQTYPDMAHWALLNWTPFAWNVGQRYTFLITDDGNYLTFGVDGATILTAATDVSFGNEIEVYGRGWDTSSVSNFSVPDAVSTLPLLGVGLAGLLFLRRKSV